MACLRSQVRKRWALDSDPDLMNAELRLLTVCCTGGQEPLGVRGDGSPSGDSQFAYDSQSPGSARKNMR